MSFLSRLNRLFDRSAAKNVPAPGAVQSTHQLAMLFGLPNGPSLAERPEEQIREGYAKNVVVYRCVREIATSAATVDLLLYKRTNGGDLLELDDPRNDLIKLMNRPNFLQSRAEFIETWVAFLMLHGESYFQAIGVDRGRRITELWPVPKTQVTPKIERGRLVAWTVMTAEGRQIDFPVDPITGASELVQTKLWNPGDPFRGMSPLQAAALSTDIHNATSEWNHSLLANGAQPSGALVMTQGSGPNAVPNRLTDEEFERVKEEVNSSHTGPNQVGKPLLLEGGLQWQAMGLSPKDMDWLNSRNTTAREIALAFGVPPMLLGIPGDNTYSNQKEARLWFWEDTVLPTLNLALGALNRFLAVQRNDDTVFFGYDSDRIPALAPRREDAWKRIQESTFLTLNEKREALGYEATDDGDVILVPNSLVPLANAANPPDPIDTARQMAEINKPAEPPANDDVPLPGNDRVATRAAEMRREIAVKSHLPELDLKLDPTTYRESEIDGRLRMIAAAENSLRVRIQAFLKEQARAVAATIRANDVNGVDDLIYRQGDELEDLLRAGYYAVSQVIAKRFLGAAKSIVRFETKDVLGAFWDRVQPFVEAQVAEKVTLINDTTRRQVKTAIADGLREGESIDDVANRVLNAMTGISGSRALTIAQTEIHTASNYAAEAAARSVGVDMDREWGAAGGDRTRPSHRAADGQIRGMEEPFDVGGAKLMYPGDPAAPARETINCRCVLLYHPKEEVRKPIPATSPIAADPVLDYFDNTAQPRARIKVADLKGDTAAKPADFQMIVDGTSKLPASFVDPVKGGWLVRGNPGTKDKYTYGYVLNRRDKLGKITLVEKPAFLPPVIRRSVDPSSIIAHELGHWHDFKRGQPSRSRDFYNRYRAMIDDMPAADKKAHAYSLSEPEEAWASVTELLLAPRKKGSAMRNSSFEKYAMKHGLVEFVHSWYKKEGLL